MVLPGFIGPTFQSQSPSADIERCINLYPETQDAGQAKNRMILLGTPGLTLLMTLPDSPHRGSFSQDGRAWMAAGGSLFEITGIGSGNYVFRGAVKNDGRRVWFGSNGLNGHQLFVVSGGVAYILDLKTNALAPVTSSSLWSPTSGGLYFDGYFITLQGGLNAFQISALNDGTVWNALGTQARSWGSDNLLAIGASGRSLWLFGSQTSEAWYDSGAASFPFAPIPGVFIEEGIAAPQSIASQFDNSILWLGRDNDGSVVARRANGYTPERISTHGVEAVWDGYATVTDAVGWTYREQGHEFWVLTFPTANATWAFDAATRMWHERSWLNPATGQMEAHLGISHCFNFETHMVGDRQSGNVYKQALGIYTDNGQPIRSVRRAPYFGSENRWIVHHKFELELEPGVGTATGQGQAPTAMLRWSGDGRTWSNEYTVPVGAMGNYGTRAVWRRLGRGRWRNYEVAVSDPVRRAWINAYISIAPGTS